MVKKLLPALVVLLMAAPAGAQTNADPTVTGTPRIGGPVPPVTEDGGLIPPPGGDQNAAPGSPTGAPLPPKKDGSPLRDIRDRARQDIQGAREGVHTTNQGLRTDTKAAIKGLRQDLRGDIKVIWDEVKGNASATKAAFDAARKEAAAEVKAKREEFQKEVDAKMADLKSKLAVNRKTLEASVQKIKDERKRQIVVQLSTNIQNLNTKHTAELTKTVDRLAEVLSKIRSRTDKAGADGRDVKAVQDAITAASGAIDTARAAIVTQTGRTYPVTIQSDTSARTDVSVARKALVEDMKKVQDLVKAAREAVQKAAQTLAKVPHVDDAQTPAGSPVTGGPNSTGGAASGTTSSSEPTGGTTGGNNTPQ